MRSLVVFMLVLLGGCMGCAPKKTIHLGVDTPSEMMVFYAPKVLDNFTKWHMFTRDSTGARVEMAFCVYGYVEDNTLFILYTETAQMGFQDERQVLGILLGRCEITNLIGWGHTHPTNNCGMSETDAITAVNLPVQYSIVVCAGRTSNEVGVSFYTKREILRRLPDMSKPP